MKTLKTTLMLTALLSGIAQAQTPICADNDETCWQKVASAQWREEFGDVPPNMTPEQEQAAWQWLKKHYPNTDFDNP